MKTCAIRARRTGRIPELTILLGLLASLSLPALAEDALGRLFFTPEQRQMLDRQRQLNIQDSRDFPEEKTLTINGIVTRSNGKRTVWINGVAQNEGEQPSGVAVVPRHGNPGKVTVEIPDISQGKASVGDNIDRNTGETTDLLNGGEIRVNARHRNEK